ncbi:hypothetical protein AB0M83_27915 [Amycolatopsis sp. NPDC051106]|uniref:hypothetical protein n=1 Tax=unclassified Amycolatopsis TaxID=2618356 RepID=UPI0034469ECE
MRASVVTLPVRHHIVRTLAAGWHHGHGQMTYPLVPGIDASARTGDGRLVYTGYARPPSRTIAVQGALALGAERVIAAGRDPKALEWLRGAGATTVSLAHDGPDGLEKALDLLRDRRIRMTGSGIGSRCTEEMLAEAPEVMARFADGSRQLPYTAFPLSRVGEAWAYTGRGRAVVVPG